MKRYGGCRRKKKQKRKKEKHLFVFFFFLLYRFLSVWVKVVEEDLHVCACACFSMLPAPRKCWFFPPNLLNIPLIEKFHAQVVPVCTRFLENSKITYHLILYPARSLACSRSAHLFHTMNTNEHALAKKSNQERLLNALSRVDCESTEKAFARFSILNSLALTVNLGEVLPTPDQREEIMSHFRNAQSARKFLCTTPLPDHCVQPMLNLCYSIFPGACCTSSSLGMNFEKSPMSIHLNTTMLWYSVTEPMLQWLQNEWIPRSVFKSLNEEITLAENLSGEMKFETRIFPPAHDWIRNSKGVHVQSASFEFWIPQRPLNACIQSHVKIERNGEGAMGEDGMTAVQEGEKGR